MKNQTSSTPKPIFLQHSVDATTLFRMALRATNSHCSEAEMATVIWFARRVLSKQAYRILEAIVWMLTQDQSQLKEQRN